MHAINPFCCSPTDFFMKFLCFHTVYVLHSFSFTSVDIGVLRSDNCWFYISNCALPPFFFFAQQSPSLLASLVHSLLRDWFCFRIIIYTPISFEFFGVSAVRFPQVKETSMVCTASPRLFTEAQLCFLVLQSVVVTSAFQRWELDLELLTFLGFPLLLDGRFILLLTQTVGTKVEVEGRLLSMLLPLFLSCFLCIFHPSMVGRQAKRGPCRGRWHKPAESSLISYVWVLTTQYSAKSRLSGTGLATFTLPGSFHLSLICVGHTSRRGWPGSAVAPGEITSQTFTWGAHHTAVPPPVFSSVFLSMCSPKHW